jgi:hypothetical protein
LCAAQHCCSGKEGRNAGRFRAFIIGLSWSGDFNAKETEAMNERDQELLDKQLQRINPRRRSEGVMVMAILAVFLAGMTFGGFLFAYKSQPMRVASYDVTAAVSVANGAPPTMQQ